MIRKSDDSHLTPADRRRQLIEWIRSHYEAKDTQRRALDLYRAGQFDRALELFQQAEALGADGTTIAGYVAGCHRRTGRVEDLAETLGTIQAQRELDTQERVTLAAALATSGRRAEAMATLRDGLRTAPEAPELHFHLGLLCAERGDYEEAELRHTQVLTIDRDHADAMVQIGLCRGAEQDLPGAMHWLQQALSRRPGDARIGVLMTQAAKALAQSGSPNALRPIMRVTVPEADAADVEQLALLVADDPDFVDAFLSLSEQDVDQEILALLLRTLEAALERQPEHAELRFHCGRVLDRLGRPDDAIAQNERAVAIDPEFTRALIELGRLYRLTNRSDDAVSRLEAALRAGADYADVHYHLGNLYRNRGEIERARDSFERALTINHEYDAAHQALSMIEA